ncbi:hypothetical protein [Paraliobacillus sp. X-1268]|uniref:hypothetical protein n=1 Tax=Paraliobacillus sp. X-1268 TaxID=2213193 RepID=UPI000E3BDE79|nr:hypothetical protein [Paraliobacillus sp. X-1268]
MKESYLIKMENDRVFAIDKLGEEVFSSGLGSFESDWDSVIDYLSLLQRKQPCEVLRQSNVHEYLYQINK